VGDAHPPGLRRALGQVERKGQAHKSYGRELSTLVQTAERRLMS
jgi:hypothetical protein